jgi:hypothetical protein
MEHPTRSVVSRRLGEPELLDEVLMESQLEHARRGRGAVAQLCLLFVQFPSGDVPLNVRLFKRIVFPTARPSLEQHPQERMQVD